MEHIGSAGYARRIFRVLSELCMYDNRRRHTGFQWIADRSKGGLYEAAFKIPIGFSIEDVEKVVPDLEAACGAPVELDDRKGAVVIRVCVRTLECMIMFEEKYLKQAAGAVLVGFDHSRQPVYFNFRPHPHMLIGGETGMGKTDLIRMIVYSLLYSGEPVEIRIVDMKAMSFMPFLNIPNVEIARDINEADKVIRETVELIRRRADDLWADRQRRAFKVKRFLIIDEAAELSPYMFKTKREKEFAGKIESNISTIARLGRECGVHLIYATQYPTAHVVNNQIKINCGTRVAFYVPNKTNSEVVLDRAGAENLNAIQGRVIYKNTKYMTLQVPYVGGDAAWEKLLSPYKQVEVISSGGAGEGVQTSSDGNDRTIIDIDSVEVPIAEQTYVGEAEVDGGRGDTGIAADGEHAESVEAHAPGPEPIESDVYDVSFGESKEAALSTDR